jgi:hypothetical protein
MLRSEDDSEVGEKLTWEERDDVHVGTVSDSDDIKTRKRDTKCEFTVRTATLECSADVFRQENPAVILNFHGDRSHVPPPSRSPAGCGFLLCAFCVR